MLPISAVIVLVLTAATVPQPKSQTCYDYEHAVKLTGTLVRKSFINEAAPFQNGKTETYWVLKLDSPICVTEDESEPDLNPHLENIRTIQLVLGQREYTIYRELVGKRVEVAGTLFGAHTAHHHTRVLLDVQKIQARKARE